MQENKTLAYDNSTASSRITAAKKLFIEIYGEELANRECVADCLNKAIYNAERHYQQPSAPVAPTAETPQA